MGQLQGGRRAPPACNACGVATAGRSRRICPRERPPAERPGHRHLKTEGLRPSCREAKPRAVPDTLSAGCLGGKSFAFISASGKVQICGFLDVECGDVRKESFSKIWRNSSVLRNIRDASRYKGKCRFCDYREVCGGCRARAYEDTGDYMEEEPDCAYQPLTAGF